MADAKLVTVDIDGIKVQVPDGTYVWDACRKIGIEIPNFCYIQGLRAFGVSAVSLGAKQLCLVARVAAGADHLGAQAVAILLVTPFSFVANKLWAFAEPARNAELRPVPAIARRRDR